MDWRDPVAQAQQKINLPAFGPGDHIRVWYRIVEHDRVRSTPFEGTVVRRRGARPSETITVRRVTHGEGVERVFPLNAPALERIEVLRRTKVHRARLYFLRAKIGKPRIAAEPGGLTEPSPEAQGEQEHAQP